MSGLTPPEWTDRAACRDAVWPDLWFATPPDPRHPLWDEPRAICQACPVRNECLERALTVGEDHGMFGGLIPEERRAMRRRAPRPVASFTHGTERGAKGHRRRGEKPCEACLRAERVGRESRRVRRAEVAS